MADLLVISSGSPMWNVCFLRVVQELEIGGISDLFGLLNATSIGRVEVDKMIWIHSGNKKFTVKFIYRVLSC